MSDNALVDQAILKAIADLLADLGHELDTDGELATYLRRLAEQKSPAPAGGDTEALRHILWNFEAYDFGDRAGYTQRDQRALAESILAAGFTRPAAEGLAQSPADALDAVKAEAWDEAVAMVCGMVGVPNVNWPNPYRTTPTEGAGQ